MQRIVNGTSRPHGQSSASSASSGSGSSKHVRCIGRYVLTGTNLGKGNFARVEAAVHTLTRSKVAIKIIETDKIREEYVRKNLLREAQLMRRLRHPNIIRLYETMKTSNLYCLVMEVAEGGELLSHVRNDFKEKRLSEATTRPFIRQLVSALYHLHTAGIVHRDLKMENIMLDRKKKQVKIVDFGLSNAQQQGSLLQTHCGSPEYAAPELFIPGREYGPEVDVWSLGVNMYAMLVGKLPFRSPRQGNKKRQKLLEQIQAGLSDDRLKDMGHVTTEARDLIGKLLQPDSHRRIKLREVMQHVWITKDRAQPLHPFKYCAPDQATQKSVMELMSAVLEVSNSEIREAVRRDRCDWMAAIYNLLIDQPEGRAVMQRLLTAGPEDQLVDAAHYEGSMQHFRLSQDLSAETTPPEVSQAMTAAVATGTHSRVGHRHSIAGATAQYPSSTLPLMKREKKRSYNEPHPLETPRQPLNPVQPPPAHRRMSVATAQIVPSYPLDRQPHGLSQPLSNVPPPSGKGVRKLPATPSEAPYQTHTLSQDSHHHRPHSRAESEPNPLPLPWRSSLVQKVQLSSGGERDGALPINPNQRQITSDEVGGNHSNQTTTPLVSPLTQMGVASKKRSKQQILLRPVRPISSGGQLRKKISMSVDTNLDTRAMQDLPPPRVPAGQLYSGGVHGGHHHGNSSSNKQLPGVGWASRFGSLPRRSRDIQGLMELHQPVMSPYCSVQDISMATGLDGTKGGASVTSVDIKPELFTKAGEAWAYDGIGVSPNGSRVGSAYGKRKVSPHGSTGVSPYGSTTVSPHGSRTVSPDGSRAVSPHMVSDLEGSKFISPSHSRVIGRPQENGGEFPKPKRRHHRSTSANPAAKVQTSDYYGQAMNGLNHHEIPNGVHHPPDHHGNPAPPHHILRMSGELSEVRRSSASKTRNHSEGQRVDKNSYRTEL